MSCCAIADCGNPACELCGRVVDWITRQRAEEAAAREQRLRDEADKRAQKRQERRR